MNGWQTSGASPADDPFVSAPDKAADMTLVWSLLVQYFKGQVNILKKENYTVTFWAYSTMLQVLVPYGLTDENSDVCTESLRFRPSVHMGSSSSTVINPVSEVGESTSL